MHEFPEEGDATALEAGSKCCTTTPSNNTLDATVEKGGVMDTLEEGTYAHDL